MHLENIKVLLGRRSTQLPIGALGCKQEQKQQTMNVMVSNIEHCTVHN